MDWKLPIGAQVAADGVNFRVWATEARQVEVVLLDQNDRETAIYELTKDENGYFSRLIGGIGAGTRYMYRLDRDRLRPDPASRFQPADIHGASEVVSPDFDWHDQGWSGLPLEDMTIYELHVGTATPEGTFEALVEKLDYLKSLGISTLEIMPVADFPGQRNWGYDGVDLYAPSSKYGGPVGLKKLVDAAHAHGLAVLLDVVYNHFGPDGNYLRDFSHQYFTHAKKSPWGDAINFSAPAVRQFFVSNVLYWACEFHLDGLRLDATPWILDDSATHILKEMIVRVRQTLPGGRHFVMIAEDDRNNIGMLKSHSEGGYGFDAVWADDFHHQTRSSFAGDNEGYFMDYTGSAADLAETLSKGWFFVGQKSQFSGRYKGTDGSSIDPCHFVYCIQNHDQIGNRAVGDRLNFSIAPDAYRAASALLLLSPYTPLLFQGQEWAASTPFLYFTDHNAELGALVTKGRQEEFSHFSGFSQAAVPDPQAVNTFLQSKLKWDEQSQPEHSPVLTLYRDLLGLRRSSINRENSHRQSFKAQVVDQDAIAMRYHSADEQDLLVIINLKDALNLTLSQTELAGLPEGFRWEPVLTTSDVKYGGQDNLDKMRVTTIQVSGPVGLVFEAVKG